MCKDTIFTIDTIAVLVGPCLAWDKSFRKLDLECDNTFLVETLSVGKTVNSRLMELHPIHRLLTQN